MLLAQAAKDPGSSEKVLRAAVLDAFPEIKVDALPKGKQAFKDNTARLLERFPSDAAKQEYIDTCSSINHPASWCCDRCTDGKFAYLTGNAGRPWPEATVKEAADVAHDELKSAVETVAAAMNDTSSAMCKILEPITEAIHSNFPGQENESPVVVSKKRTHATISQVDGALAACQNENNKLRKQVRDAMKEHASARKQIANQAKIIANISSESKRKLRECKKKNEADWTSMKTTLKTQGAKCQGTRVGGYGNTVWDGLNNTLFKESKEERDAREDRVLEETTLSPAFLASVSKETVLKAIEKKLWTVETVPEGKWQEVVETIENPVAEGGLNNKILGSQTRKVTHIKKLMGVDASEKYAVRHARFKRLPSGRIMPHLPTSRQCDRDFWASEVGEKLRQCCFAVAAERITKDPDGKTFITKAASDGYMNMFIREDLQKRLSECERRGLLRPNMRGDDVLDQMYFREWVDHGALNGLSTLVVCWTLLSKSPCFKTNLTKKERAFIRKKFVIQVVPAKPTKAQHDLYGAKRMELIKDLIADLVLEAHRPVPFPRRTLKCRLRLLISDTKALDPELGKKQGGYHRCPSKK